MSKSVMIFFFEKLLGIGLSAFKMTYKLIMIPAKLLNTPTLNPTWNFTITSQYPRPLYLVLKSSTPQIIASTKILQSIIRSHNTRQMALMLKVLMCQNNGGIIVNMANVDRVTKAAWNPILNVLCVLDE
ncbi:hypothetical protein WICPIJ_004640 [Wickerhamomyces pijperi]|uniref:Uncharacterized protein n=1 Tax=Wickerhamomyces pijperi TaxID=599730 RepID=A0A9P8TMK6_WICPI|nr:hypothetical protein WICPIJ_004640 [Wickerhamomyces pijperi]